MSLSLTDVLWLIRDTVQSGLFRPAGLAPKLRPSLSCGFVPKLHTPPTRPWEVYENELPYIPHGLRGQPVKAGPPGLVRWSEFGERNPHGLMPERRGMKGPTRLANHRVRDGCAVLQQWRPQLSFWTVNLPTEVLLEIGARDAWAVFVDGMRRRLVARLEAAGIEPLIVGVVEMGPERTIRLQQSMPHLHIAYRAKASPRDRWLMTPERHDRIVREALADIGIEHKGPLPGCNVQPIDKDVQRYMAKYLTKATRSGGSGRFLLGDVGLCPRQWFLMSRPLLRLVLERTIELPAGFCAWLADRFVRPERKAPYWVQKVDQADPRAPACWCLSFRSPPALLALFQQWEAALRPVAAAA